MRLRNYHITDAAKQWGEAMKKQEFLNRLKSLRHIDSPDLDGISGTEIDKFLRSPVQYFITADDRVQDVIWAAVEARQKP